MLYRNAQTKVMLARGMRSPPSSPTRGSLVQDMWRPLAPDTLKNLRRWIEHFESRSRLYTERVMAEPIVMWLSRLHLPEAYVLPSFRSCAA